MIVDTHTLAAAVKLSPSMIRRYAKRGTITPLPIRTGRNGRPTMWFDLDTSIKALLDLRSPMHESDQ